MAKDIVFPSIEEMDKEIDDKLEDLADFDLRNMVKWIIKKYDGVDKANIRKCVLEY